LERLLAVPGADARARVAGLYGILHLEWSQGDYVAFQRHCEERLALCEAIGNGPDVASALYDLSVVASYQRRYADARRLVEEHLALSQRHGVPPSPRARQNLGNVARDAGDFSRAHAMYADALVQDGHSASMRATILSNMGWLALYEGDLARARAWQAESLTARRKLGEHREVPISLTALAHVAIESSDPPTAAALLTEAVPLDLQVRNRWGQALALEALAALVAAEHPGDALRLAGAADGLRGEMRRPPPVAQQPLLDRWLASAQQKLDAREQEVARAEGRAVGADEALALGMRLLAVERAGRVGAGPITRRERDVAALVGQGLSNQQIADQLVITRRTVAAHVKHILNKLGFTSRTQIGFWATEHGVVSRSAT